MKFAILMMTWDRACWSSRNRTLFGEKKNIYAITRKRLLVEAKVWRTATMREQLIEDAHIRVKKKTLKTAASITVATWLDELHEVRRKIFRRKTINIIIISSTTEELREADVQLKRKINAARRTTLRTDRNGVGERAVDTSTEEPPD